ncbi:hypothetical protein GCM10009663_27030 [Kitasatospora arboriphila]|uniref:Uncharacterized protein n=1 Tax=Kitasatospora arboriphila TaxID=258052 RepID=A0ABP4DZW2_9ACTN
MPAARVRPQGGSGDGGNDDSIEALKSQRDDKQSSAVDVDPEVVEGLELPGADPSGENSPSRWYPSRRTSSPA